MVYVCEMSANRLLRFFQKPTGVFHYSVFRQFSGGVGPSCVAVDKAGKIYIGHYDLGAGSGRISVLSPDDGKVIQELSVPGPEVTGLAISPDNSLLVTEASTKAVYRLSL
jgi:aspartate beta-hydroxylase